MKAYFQLHVKMMSRKLWEIGFKPAFGFILLLVCFIAFSWFLFRQTNYAHILVALAAVFYAGKLSNTKRNDLLKLSFGDSAFRQLRLIENLVLTVPFTVILIAHQEFIFALIIILINSLQAFTNAKKQVQPVIPTPFGKRPFEFPSGFRSSIIPILLSLTIAIYALTINNFNLIIFSMLLVFAIAISFYLKAENEFFVWIFNKSPLKFLLYKILVAWMYVSLLLAPILILLFFYYLNEFQYILIFLAFGYIYLATTILAIYACFPFELNVENTILIGASIFFPPILIITIPFFYFGAKNRVIHYLP